MKKGWGVLIILILTCSLLGTAFASSKVGTSGAQFLKIGVGSRATAMGGVYTGVADDVSAIYWNPGGLGLLQSRELLLVYNSWFQDITHEFGAFAIPMGNIGVLGIGVTMLGMDDLEKRTIDVIDKEGTFKAQDTAIALSYGKAIGEKLSIGLSVKSLSSKIDTEKASGIAVDVGSIIKTGLQGLNVGVAVTNIGGKYKFMDEGDPLPMTIKVGAGYKILHDALTLALDINAPNDNDVQFGGGVEYALKFGQNSSFALRTGYKTGVDTGGLSGFGAGLGIKFNWFGFDFAWLPYGDLGDTMKGSVSFKF